MRKKNAINFFILAYFLIGTDPLDLPGLTSTLQEPEAIRQPDQKVVFESGFRYAEGGSIFRSIDATGGDSNYSTLVYIVQDRALSFPIAPLSNYP